MVADVKTDIMNRLRGLGKKYRYTALILALGVALMLIPTGGKSKDTQEPVTVMEEAVSQNDFDLTVFTKNAEQLLSGIQGAGKVSLLFTLEQEGVSTYLFDETSRQNPDDSERQTETVLTQRDGDQVPVTVTRTFPKFRGAVVLCQGAQDPNVILGIKEAISSLTGLGMDKITVLKMD